MPLEDYGVLVGRAVDRRREGHRDDTPHYRIRLVDGSGTDHRGAVNVLSQLPPSELLALVDEDFRHPVTGLLCGLESGWHPLTSTRARGSLDYIRGNVFDPSAMRPLPPDLPGVDNDLVDRLDHQVLRAQADPQARVYGFGERWGPEPAKPDKVFRFLPGNGVHDVHMNQGNSGRFRRDNGVWQDGALLLHFGADDRWVAVFLAFQSQSWHTDDVTGDALGDTPPRPEDRGTERLRIVAALVNPVGSGQEAETVTLLNASPAPIELGGWRLVDVEGRVLPAPAVTVPAGATVVVPLDGHLQLGNRGGALTLLDPDGLKVHGVAYTREQARREGWTVAF